MAVAQILDENLRYISERFLKAETVTNKVKLGDGLELKEDGNLYAINSDTQQNNKIQELETKNEQLENRIEQLENYIDLLKQTYIIELSNGDTIP
jgi:predicted RNase H-like nuclease (RuvC/YqgF family)